ncbi:MAG: beta-glucuronidase [Bacillota bacterium]|nr:beta-glucuronidase [Bacillota bacterium]
MLYPIENGIREVKDLSGLWDFKADYDNKGREEEWYKSRLLDTIIMPVPASYNDITVEEAIRDHIGDVWYERNFYIPAAWKDKRIVLRVGSASHHAVLWVNGCEAARHKGGYLPFEAEITDMVQIGGENRVTIAVNNVLDWSCIPSGEIKTYEGDEYPRGYRTQETFFDFYNYSGIHRPVRLYVTPKIYIADITVVTEIDGETGIVDYNVSMQGGIRDIRIRLLDADGNLAAESAGTSGRLDVQHPSLWQPGKGYLYRLIAETLDSQGNIEDSYELPVGIRTIKVEGNKFLINGKPFYFKGFGKHEDSDIRGKGLDEVLNIRDFNLLRWIGANSFRTSHYPYSEEVMRLADREGMVIIDEVPAVGMCFFDESKAVFREDRVNEKTLEHHLQAMKEMIARDKNHPCVVMWSIANEAATNEEASVPYFTNVVEKTRRLDPTRPVTIVMTPLPESDKAGGLVDVICVNRYYGWYQEHGRLELIEKLLEHELKGWYKKYNKPIIFSEFGADTVAGFHQLPAVSFSEEFQVEYLKRHHKVLDSLEFVIGEHVWNFADFATKQGITRVIGNRKGVFTRQRQPKAAAFVLRERWMSSNPKWNEE